MADLIDLDWRNYLESAPDVHGGKPVVRGTGLTAEFLLGRLVDGMTIQEVAERYPQITPEALCAVFALAAEAVHRRYPGPTPDDFYDGLEWTVIEW